MFTPPARRATRGLSAAALLTSVALLASGCAAFSDEGPGATRAADGRVQVVAALYPLQYVAERVGGSDVDVTDLTHPGQEPHDLELSPAQVADVASADLVVYEKGLQASVDAAVGQADPGTALDAGAVAGLEPVGHGGKVAVDTSAVGSEEEEEDASGLDPHFWQDPLKMAKVADAVAERLATIDPDHASAYRQRAAALDQQLRGLDRAYSKGLADCARDTIVVSHDAFGYLTRYGLRIEPISGLSPDAEPTPADLARLQQVIRSDGITTVFGEVLASPAFTESLARDTGVRTAVLDPIEGLSSATADQDYLSLMRENLAQLRKADACR